MEPAQRTQRTHQREAIISRYANRQHGVFTRRQAIEAGYSASAISRRRASGVWNAVDISAYCLAGTPSIWKQRLMAACLLGPAVASHRSAGVLWDFPGMPVDIIDVTALRHRRRRASDVAWHESYHLTERDTTVLDSIPVTKPVRTFLDLALVLTPNRLEEVFDNGCHRGLLDIPSIWRRLGELGDVRPGAIRVRALLGSRTSADSPAESVLETRFRQLLRSAGLPMPMPQHEIRGNGLAARVDFACPDRKLAIELDGVVYHSSRSALGRDRSRENQLVTLGWRVLRFTWDDIFKRPDAVVRCVQGAR